MQDLEFPRLMYRPGTAWVLESGVFDLLTVNSAADAEAAHADGWRLDQYAARDVGAEPVNSPAPAAPTRAELEAQAKALGLTWHHRTGDAKLAELIKQAGG